MAIAIFLQLKRTLLDDPVQDMGEVFDASLAIEGRHPARRGGFCVLLRSPCRTLHHSHGFEWRVDRMPLTSRTLLHAPGARAICMLPLRPRSS